jgi:hypothetical protein
MSYVCSICGEVHNDRPAYAFISPFHYHVLSPEDQATTAKLSDDWCIIGHDTQADHFIRAVLKMPITGTDDTFEYGVWVSLSEKNFVHYMDNFNEDLEGTTFFGYLCNQMPDYENTLLIKTDVVCGPKGQRPEVFLQSNQEDNPFVTDFIKGITKEEADRRTHQLLE